MSTPTLTAGDPARPRALAVTDACSLLVEGADWLARYSDAGVRDRLAPLPPTDLSGAGHPAAARDPDARSRLLDALGLARQLVLTAGSTAQFAASPDLEVRYGGALAHNRGVIDFCAEDRRLLPVAHLPLDDPRRSEPLLSRALSAGARAVEVTVGGADVRSPALAPLWHRVADAGVPVVLAERPWLPGAPDVVSTLTALALDGPLARVPDLRVAVVGAGAAWLPGWLRRLDALAHGGRRTGPDAEDLRRRLLVTPGAGEPLTALLNDLGDDVLGFSTGFPLEAARPGDIPTQGWSVAGRRAFLSGNADRLLGARLPPTRP